MLDIARIKYTFIYNNGVTPCFTFRFSLNKLPEEPHREW